MLEIEDLGLDVSRETLDKLRGFQALVEKWTPHINLIAKGTRDEVWHRHILDSAQIYSLGPDNGDWMDLGSGGGFPGIVLAILSEGAGRTTKFSLVESDSRKCVFLKTAARELSLSIEVKAERIENLTTSCVNAVSARALASLERLLEFSVPHLHDGSLCLFPKGKNWRFEEIEARKKWSFDLNVVQSSTDADSAILVVRNLIRKRA